MPRNYREFLKSVLARIIASTGIEVSAVFPAVTTADTWAFAQLIGEHDTGERDDSNNAKLWEAAFWVYIGYKVGVETEPTGSLDAELSRVQDLIKTAFETVADDVESSYTSDAYSVEVQLAEVLQFVPGQNYASNEAELQLVGRILFTQFYE